ncbi:MAG: hypothetical protein DI586_01085 [Micavibrio aeruginosavorus]|uniref:Uncharacterized protein n=1 Tax=Micavibrio aeruginosavorus TaxID=349221 RepID=A0A2W5HGB0_9BACT|nr:MAG: hypothetical protein DI586_01085 [Micavibrio aeruginosavorus]
MKLSNGLLGGFLAASVCAGQPAMAQTQGPPNVVDTGKLFSIEEMKQPIFSLSAPLNKSKSKNLKLEFGRYGSDAEVDNKSGLKWEIAPGMEMKAKYKRVKFTWEF